MSEYKSDYKKIKKYRGGRHAEVHEKGNPETVMKHMQRWLKESNFFIELKEREHYDKPSSKRRKAKHLAESREEKRWERLEESDGPVRTKRIRNKSNRGKKTRSEDLT